jgi:prepilin-type N-terminal cleavage/methylation domain-containing protein
MCAFIQMEAQTDVVMNLVEIVVVKNILTKQQFLVLQGLWKKHNTTPLQKLGMNCKLKLTQQKSKKAFTLIESLISVVIMAIGFLGVYQLVSTSNTLLYESIERQKLSFQAGEIIESLYADQSNIIDYHGKDLSQCNDIKVAQGKDDQLKKLKHWCQKLQGEQGDKRTQDKRLIRAIKAKDGDKNVYVVSIELSGKNDKKTVFMKRVFNAK